jgi:hypothetical protein
MAAASVARSAVQNRTRGRVCGPAFAVSFAGISHQQLEVVMLAEKKALTLADLDAQSALELPAREVPQIIVTITNLLNNNTVTIDVRNIDVAAQICAQVIATGRFSCTVTQ